MSYVPLHVHTEYSILDGMCKVKELVARAKEIGCNSLAITDHGRCHGWLPFYTECKKQGIKPILGVEVYVVPDRLVKEAREGYHLILLAKNEEGYKNIIKIVSDAEEKGFYYKPKTDINVLREYGKGIIASSACMSGEIPKFLINGEYDRAKELALEYSKIFDEFYLELQATPTPDQLKLNSLIIELHEDTRIPLIVTTDTHYVMREDAIVHEVLLAVQTAAIFTEEDLKALNIFDGVYLVNDDKPKSKRKTSTKKERTRFKLDSYNYWLKSKNEIMDMMPSYNGLLEVALENTQKIADKCELEIEFGKFKLPAYDIPDGHTADSLLAEKCYSALFDYFMENPHLDPNKYYDRLKYELEVMHEAGIAAYFLIDQDFIQWAKKNNIAVGPGRGSASASLVAFLLGIVELDPLGNKTNIEMIFERFYVKGRRDLPDCKV